MKQKLLSRKLWIAILTLAVLILNKQYDAAVWVVLGYLGVQGAQDVVTAHKGVSSYVGLPESTMSQNVATEPDVLITGAELDNKQQ